MEAARYNAELFRRAGGDLGKLIALHENSTIGFGSEFRPVRQLETLLKSHPHFERLENLLTSGMDYALLSELDTETRAEELRTLLVRGNHKSAKDTPDQVSRLLDKDVTHGFAVPVPKDFVEEIPGATVQPLGLAQQWTLDEFGNRIIKFRLTQDLSFSSNRVGPPRSINSRVNMKAYPEMVYGWCLPRVMHYVVSLRLAFPTLGILICKYDYSDAYRRVAHSAWASVQTIATHGELAYLSLRLTFGGSPNPPTWCLVSEMVTDLANEINKCIEWDYELVRSPAQPHTPAPRRQPASVPLAQAKPMAVQVPTTGINEGRVDCFIDDLINVFLDTPENCRRQPHVVPLAMHVTSRPHAGEAEPIMRRPILSQPKLEAEGSPDESQIVLGWRIDTRRLLVSLPDDKYEAWKADLKRAISTKSCPFQELEALVGRLNHSALVVPLTRHFLNRIRNRLAPKHRRGDMGVRLGEEVVADMRLWLTILKRANRGIPINLIVTRQPNRVCWSDSCPYGMGGYNLSGRAWRLRIPEDSPLRGHLGINNLLEFLAMAINVWVQCLDPAIGDHDCILAIGDSTSAIGWIHKAASLNPDQGDHAAHLMVSRKIAELVIRHECCLATQHIKGELNVVADLLSYAGEIQRGGGNHPIARDNPPNDILTNRFLSKFPAQVPASFAISQLPNEILCWVTLVLQTATSSMIAAKRDETRRKRTGPGEDGSGTSGSPAFKLTPSSLCYLASSESFVSKHSSNATETPSGKPTGTLQETVHNRWWLALSAKPQVSWLRRSGQISSQVPCMSNAVPTCDHSSDNS